MLWSLVCVYSLFCVVFIDIGQPLPHPKSNFDCFTLHHLLEAQLGNKRECRGSLPRLYNRCYQENPKTGVKYYDTCEIPALAGQLFIIISSQTKAIKVTSLLGVFVFLVVFFLALL